MLRTFYFLLIFLVCCAATTGSMISLWQIRASNASGGDVIKFDGNELTYSPDLTLDGRPSGGDLNGLYPSPTVLRVRGQLWRSTAPSLGEFPRWDGGGWVPSTVSTVRGIPYRTGGLDAGDLLFYDGTHWGYTEPDLTLRGTPIAAADPTIDQALVYDGTRYRPKSIFDNLGNHIAAQNFQLGPHWLSSDGSSTGMSIEPTGKLLSTTDSSIDYMENQGRDGGYVRRYGYQLANGTHRYFDDYRSSTDIRFGLLTFAENADGDGLSYGAISAGNLQDHFRFRADGSLRFLGDSDFNSSEPGSIQYNTTLDKFGYYGAAGQGWSYMGRENNSTIGQSSQVTNYYEQGLQVYAYTGTVSGNLGNGSTLPGPTLPGYTDVSLQGARIKFTNANGNRQTSAVALTVTSSGQVLLQNNSGGDVSNITYTVYYLK